MYTEVSSNIIKEIIVTNNNNKMPSTLYNITVSIRRTDNENIYEFKPRRLNIKYIIKSFQIHIRT